MLDWLLGFWLPLAVLPDIAVVPITSQAFGMGVAAALNLTLVIAVGEGVVLRRLDRMPTWRAIAVAAVAMNASSSAAGMLLGRARFHTLEWLGERLVDLRGMSRAGLAESLSAPGALVHWFAAFAFLWLVTTLIEAVVLHVMRSDGRPWRSLQHSAAVNAVSYVPLAVGLLWVMQQPFTPPL